MKDPDAWVAFERGAIDEAEFAARFFRDRRPWDAAALFARIRESYAWRPGAEALLRGLDATGVEMHACSNYPSWYRWIEARLGLTRYLPWSFVSCHTGHRKPEAAAFTHLLRELELDPGAVLFVDDQRANREAAEAQGIEAFDPARLDSLGDALRAALRRRGATVS